jgi:hypothetical protein
MQGLLVAWFDGQPAEPNPHLWIHRLTKGFEQYMLVYPHADFEEQANIQAQALQKTLPKTSILLQNARVAPHQLDNPITLQLALAEILRKYKTAFPEVLLGTGSIWMQQAVILANVNGLADNLWYIKNNHLGEDGQQAIQISLKLDDTPLTLVYKNLPADAAQRRKYYLTPTLKPLYNLAEKAGFTPVNVLISGEYGTGTELLAETVFREDLRQGAELCHWHATQIDPSRLQDLAERIDQPRTVWLNQVELLDMGQQVMLLQFLHNYPHAHLRWVCTANQDLAQACREGRFLWELYYTLAVVELNIPSLRARGKTEIDYLLKVLLQEKRKELGKKKTLKLERPTNEALLNYPFEGNVRELENLVASLYTLYGDEVERISPEMLPERYKSSTLQSSLLWKDAEQAHILKVYELCEQKIKPTARALGIAYNTLKSKLRSYDLLDKAEDSGEGDGKDE